jgi:antitoxin Phd
MEAMKRLNTTAVREGLSDILNQVAYAKERVILHRRGKDVAALVSMEDLLLLQALEDRLDNEAAAAALEEPGASILWEQVKRELGLLE